MNAMAASIGANPSLVQVECVRTGEFWHRRVRLGALGWWIPEGCQRDASRSLDQIAHQLPGKPGLPEYPAVCRVCWPVWPPLKH